MTRATALHTEVEPALKRYCFRNAYRLARARPELSYVEGFALDRDWTGFQKSHAWCADAAGLVYDPTPTWADPGGRLDYVLIGVALPLDVVESYVEREEATRGYLDEMDSSGRINEATALLGIDPV